jgi:hypothetical protein
LRAEVPFRLVGGEQPLIVVSAPFNGSEPIDCALDTGASHAIPRPLGQAIGARLDGIIGTKVLRRFRLTVDYPAQELRLDETRPSG